MRNFRDATAARLAAVGVCVGVAAFSVAACGPATPSTPAGTSSSAGSASPATGSAPAAPTAAASSSPSAGGMYGDPAAAAKYWQQQSLEDNCGLMAVADVVGEISGHAPTEQQMIALAEATPSQTNPGPIYAPRDDPSHATNGGIELADEVVLLDHYGIKSEMTYAAHPDRTGLPALEQYLAHGRKVIAWLNSAIIWNTGDQRGEADHFVVVTGIDTDREIVHLNDPGADHPDEGITFRTFTSAWHTGEESIVVTG